MLIVSLLVRIRPDEASEVSTALAGIPGVSVHGLTPDGGRLIVMVEDGEHYSVSDSILALSTTPRVLGTTLAYEYTDEAPPQACAHAVFQANRATSEETRP